LSSIYPAVLEIVDVSGSCQLAVTAHAVSFRTMTFYNLGNLSGTATTVSDKIII
jgi:hypothetical protein